VAFAAMGAGAVLWMRPPAATTPSTMSAAPLAGAGPAAASVRDLAGDVQIVRAGRSVMRAARAAALLPGDELVTRDGAKTTFDLPGGASVAVSPESRVRWLSEPGAAAADLRLALAQGRVDLRVPPRDGSLVVLTPHAELVVRGTAFTVNVMKAPDRGDGTCVAVSEGALTVRARGQEAKVVSGGTWSSFVDRSLCGLGFAVEKPAVENPEPTTAKVAVSAVRKAKVPASATRPPRPSRPASSSSLALENRLFHAAALAHQRGDDAESIRLFDELVRTYPDSALVPEALETRRRAAERLEGAGGGR
jgi:hypothetical protein